MGLNLLFRTVPLPKEGFEFWKVKVEENGDVVVFFILKGTQHFKTSKEYRAYMREYMREYRRNKE